MTGLFLIIWFYIYAGLMFSMVSTSVGLFPVFGHFEQIILWPGLLVVYLCKCLVNSKLWWFLKYVCFKVNN